MKEGHDSFRDIPGIELFEAPKAEFEELQPAHMDAGSSIGSEGGHAHWHKRNINRMVKNEIGATLDNGLITLPAGSYAVVGISTGYRVGRFSIRIRDVDSDSAICNSKPLYAAPDPGRKDDGNVVGDCYGVAVLEKETRLALELICQKSVPEHGLGRANHLGQKSSVFSRVFISSAPNKTKYVAGMR